MQILYAIYEKNHKEGRKNQFASAQKKGVCLGK